MWKKPSKPAKQSTATLQPAPSLNSLFLPDRISKRADHVMIENAYTRVMSIDALPEQIHYGWLSNVSAIPGVTVSVTVHPYTHEEASNRVSEEKTKLGAELIQAEKKHDSRRMDVLNVKYFFYRQLLADINLHRTNMMSLSVVLSVSAPTYDELNIKCQKIQDMLGATRAATMYFRQITGLKALLPGISPISEYHDVTVDNAACMAPLLSYNLSHPSGVFFGQNETGNPCFLDLFIGEPRMFGPHMAIFGMTRSGKSYTVKGLAARSVAMQRKVVIIDPEGEYRSLIAALEGKHIRFYPNMPVMFNPFDVSPSYDDQIGNFLDIAGKTDDIVSLIASMLEAQSNEKMTAEERAIASRAVRMEYEERKISEGDPESRFNPGNRESEEGVSVGKSLKEMPTFSSLTERIKSMGATRLYNLLGDFCKGGTLGFFDGQTTTDISNVQVVDFDISGLDNQYSKMYVMFVLLMWLWDNYVKTNRTQEKHIITDETWLLMLYKYTAEFLSQCARRGAKYNTSLIAASQSFREFGSEEGQTFLNQCDTKFILKMQESDAKKIGKIFDLPDNLAARIPSFQRGQGVLRAGNESAVVHFMGFPFEEEFLRSDPGAVLMR